MEPSREQKHSRRKRKIAVDGPKRRTSGSHPRPSSATRGKAGGKDLGGKGIVTNEAGQQTVVRRKRKPSTSKAKQENLTAISRARPKPSHKSRRVAGEVRVETAGYTEPGEYFAEDQLAAQEQLLPAVRHEAPKQEKEEGFVASIWGGIVSRFTGVYEALANLGKTDDRMATIIEAAVAFVFGKEEAEIPPVPVIAQA